MVRNVVLLSIDALRADHLSCYGYDRETTPNIDRFAEEAVLYENAFSASSHTREAVPAMLTGQYPERALDENFRLDAPTIATHLKDTHSTAAFHSNPYVSRAYGFGRDFDKFYDDLRLGQNRYIALLQRALDKFVFNRGAYHARAERINDRSLSWLDSLADDEPFFLWNHYMDVHGPYNPPDGFNEWADDSVTNGEAQELYDRCTSDEPDLSGTEEQLLLNLYDGEISYVDDQVEQLLVGLRKRDLLRDTLVVLTSDHGDLFGEYGRFGHPRFPYEELTHVPLIVSYTTKGQNGIVNEPVSTVDIHPEILNSVSAMDSNYSDSGLSKVGKSNQVRKFVYGSATGENESSSIRRFSIFTEYWQVWSEWNIDTGDKLSSDKLFYRGENSAAEEEETSSRDEIMDRLSKELENHVQDRLNNKFEDEQSNVSSNIDERLEALGYKK